MYSFLDISFCFAIIAKVGRHSECALQGVPRFAGFPDGPDDHEPDKTLCLVWLFYFDLRRTNMIY